MNPLLAPIVASLANTVLETLITSPKTTVTVAEAPVVRQEIADAVSPMIAHLTNSEPFYRSRVSWGACFAILGGVATIGTAVANGTFSPEIHGPALMSILGGVTTLYGRWKARTPIGA